MRYRENQRAPFAVRGNDLYETQPVAVQTLLEEEWLPEHLWDPCCGPGVITRMLRAAGHRVTATDLVDYGLENSMGGIDFLKVQEAPHGTQAIVMNPPFKCDRAFVRKALTMSPRVIVLLRLGFLAGTGHSKIMDGGLLARVLVFRNRLPMMHRHGWDGKKTTNMTNFAWFVWERGHLGLPLINRVTWKPIE